MPPVNHLSPIPPPPPPPSSGLHSRHNSEVMHKDHILNVSPRPSHHLNHIVRLGNTSNGEHSFGSITSLVSDGKTTLKSSAKLVQEIDTLEVEILRIERYLVSLYRTAFQQHLPRIVDNQVQQIKPASNQPSLKTKLGPSKDYNARQFQDSPRISLAGLNGPDKDSIQKSSSGRERRRANSRHCSLADHLGNCCVDDARICPARLSENVIRCISSIYCKLANPSVSDKGCSGSSTSSFGSSSTLSPKNLSGSWSSQCNDEGTQGSDFEGPKQENGPYGTMVEVLEICLDDESYSYAATMLQKFRSLVRSLEIVDPMKMRREEKLAFGSIFTTPWLCTLI